VDQPQRLAPRRLEPLPRHPLSSPYLALRPSALLEGATYVLRAVASSNPQVRRVT
jgi:hypothetical protein